MNSSTVPNAISIEQEAYAFKCDLSYNSTTEICKYLIQLSYLLPGAVLHFMVLRTVLGTHWNVYKTNSYFLLYSVDCVGSLSSILIDILFGRFQIFVTPYCHFISPFIMQYILFFKTTYILSNGTRAAKSVTQIFIILNRMTCIITPISYQSFWKKSTSISIGMIVIMSIGINFNLFLSDIYPIQFFGGFSFVYIKKIKWASISAFQLTYLSCAFSFTIVCSLITLCTLAMLPHRIKQIEKTITIACIITSFCFMITAFFQLLFVAARDLFDDDVTIALSYITFDILNVGSPVILILMSSQLRKHIFENGKSVDQSMFKHVSNVSK